MQSTERSLSFEPSEELLQAQQRLLQLRERLGILPKVQVEPRLPNVPQMTWDLRNAQRALQEKRLQQGIARAAIAITTRITPWPETATTDSDGSIALEPAAVQGAKVAGTITVHPTIAMAILRKHLEASARIYFLLRTIDQAGRGWLPIEDIRRHLTAKDSPLHICGWRRLRQLLAQGEGVFWHRDDQHRSAGPDRLWLIGAHKIAYTLDSDRLQGFPIELPIQMLLGGIQAVRAAFYACFHGGRDAKPISRETLRTVSGVAERTQRAYDRVAQIKRRRNVAIGEHYTSDNAQERAWKQGRAVFHFVDVYGRQGRKGREYVAWHLPNSYQATYQRRSRGSRKRLNRKLADLLTKGITGNDDQAIEKLFFPNGALAARQYNRDPERDAYWQQDRSTRAGDGLWHVMAGMRG